MLIKYVGLLSTVDVFVLTRLCLLNLKMIIFIIKLSWPEILQRGECFQRIASRNDGAFPVKNPSCHGATENGKLLSLALQTCGH